MRKLIAPLAVSAALMAAPSAWGQSGLRNVPVGFCAISSLGSAVGFTTSNCVFGSFTGVIAGVTLTASSVTGSLLPGQPLIGTGIPTGTTIASQSIGTAGKAGNYTLAYPPGTTTLTVTSESMTTAGIPPAAGYIVLCATSQAINYRDDLTAPTATAGTGGQFVPSGACLPYNGTPSRLQFIQQAGGAILGASFYQ